MSSAAASVGDELLSFAAELYPICRSITGNGLRETLRLIQKRIPLVIHEVASGSKVFDWEVPLEWNIEGAVLRDPDGRPVVDFRAHNLHVVSYSEPVNAQLSWEDLKPHLHVHASNPEWIPYRTSYYKRNWGFCLPRNVLETLQPGRYQVQMSSSLKQGSLSYGEFLLPGATREEMLLFTHACHPSLANDNTSGMAIATQLAGWLAEAPRRFTYRIVFAPGTIGSLCWLKRNEKHLGRIRHGLVLGLLGDAAPFTYKASRRGTAEIDAIAKYVLSELEPERRVIPFEPYGYDERQLCSPGFDLPVGRLTRSVNDGYAQYHSSADNLSLLSAAVLARSFEACQRIIMAVEGNRRFINLSPKGEPRLGKRGLYGSMGGQSPASRERAMLWVLSQSDGTQSLLDIAQQSQLGFATIQHAAAELETAKLLRAQADQVGREVSGQTLKKKPKKKLSIKLARRSAQSVKTAKRSVGRRGGATKQASRGTRS